MVDGVWTLELRWAGRRGWIRIVFVEEQCFQFWVKEPWKDNERMKEPWRDNKRWDFGEFGGWLRWSQYYTILHKVYSVQSFISYVKNCLLFCNFQPERERACLIYVSFVVTQHWGRNLFIPLALICSKIWASETTMIYTWTRGLQMTLIYNKTWAPSLRNDSGLLYDMGFRDDTDY